MPYYTFLSIGQFQCLVARKETNIKDFVNYLVTGIVGLNLAEFVKLIKEKFNYNVSYEFTMYYLENMIEHYSSECDINIDQQFEKLSIKKVESFDILKILNDYKLVENQDYKCIILNNKMTYLVTSQTLKYILTNILRHRHIYRKNFADMDLIMHYYNYYINQNTWIKLRNK